MDFKAFRLYLKLLCTMSPVQKSKVMINGYDKIFIGSASRLWLFVDEDKCPLNFSLMSDFQFEIGMLGKLEPSVLLPVVKVIGKDDYVVFESKAGQSVVLRKVAKDYLSEEFDFSSNEKYVLVTQAINQEPVAILRADTDLED